MQCSGDAAAVSSWNLSLSDRIIYRHVLKDIQEASSVCLCMCVYIWMSDCVYVLVCVCVCVCIYGCLIVCLCVCVCMSVYKIRRECGI
jgi:hypothetical protein